MKNLIFILVLFFISCVDRSIEIIDGCEYIKTTTYGDGPSQTLTHKGNCKNPIHQNTKPSIDTVKSVVPIKYYDLTKLKNQ